MTLAKPPRWQSRSNYYQSQSMPRSNHRDRRKTGDAERKHADVHNSRDTKIDSQCEYTPAVSLKWYKRERKAVIYKHAGIK